MILQRKERGSSARPGRAGRRGTWPRHPRAPRREKAGPASPHPGGRRRPDLRPRAVGHGCRPGPPRRRTTRLRTEISRAIHPEISPIRSRPRPGIPPRPVQTTRTPPGSQSSPASASKTRRPIPPRPSTPVDSPDAEHDGRTIVTMPGVPRAGAAPTPSRDDRGTLSTGPPAVAGSSRPSRSLVGCGCPTPGIIHRRRAGRPFLNAAITPAAPDHLGAEFVRGHNRRFHDILEVRPPREAPQASLGRLRCWCGRGAREAPPGRRSPGVQALGWPEAVVARATAPP